jgi:hypothetical protein
MRSSTQRRPLNRHVRRVIVDLSPPAARVSGQAARYHCDQPRHCQGESKQALLDATNDGGDPGLDRAAAEAAETALGQLLGVVFAEAGRGVRLGHPDPTVALQRPG